jgi:hypothetical protein
MEEQSTGVTVILSMEAYRTLRELAFNSQKSESEMLRDALALKKYYDDVRRSGGRILVERDGAVTELRFH